MNIPIPLISLLVVGGLVLAILINETLRKLMVALVVIALAVAVGRYMT